MEDLQGKMLCNVSFDCLNKGCNHMTPHAYKKNNNPEDCDAECHGGTCVPIQVFRENDGCIYAVKMPGGNYHRITQDPTLEMPAGQAPAIPEFYMDEKIYICSSHASCPNNNCGHKQFHNKNQGCESECSRLGSPNNVCEVTCREANNDEILQLFREHDGENQHIADLLELDDKAYSDLIEVLTKSKPEPPKPVHERVKRFLNLEL